jgi:hypothetical protein
MAAGLAATLHAASIRGTVVENQTSRPVARTAVQMQPIAGTAGQTVVDAAARILRLGFPRLTDESGSVRTAAWLE